MRPVVTLATWHLYDDSIWDTLSVPAGSDKLLLIKTIEDRSSEFGTIYHDPVAVKAQISILSDRFQWGMERDWAALHEEFNALHNYDRYEEYSDSESSTGRSQSISSSGSTTTLGSSNTVTDSLKAFDSTAFTDSNKSVSTGSGSDQVTSTGSGETTASTDRELTHNAHLFGNIGTTKSTEMLADAHDLFSTMDFYETWADRFIHALCVCIY